MSSPTILFVLKEIMDSFKKNEERKPIFLALLLAPALQWRLSFYQMIDYKKRSYKKEILDSRYSFCRHCFEHERT